MKKKDRSGIKHYPIEGCKIYIPDPPESELGQKVIEKKKKKNKLPTAALVVGWLVGWLFARGL